MSYQFLEWETLEEGSGLVSIVNMLSLRYLSDIGVQMWSSQLDL